MTGVLPVGRTLMFLSVVFLMAGPVRAQVVLISNLPGNDASQSADLTNLRNKGMGFTLPPGQDYTLLHVTLRLETIAGAPVPIVEIWTNAAGVPGTVIETLTSPVLNATGITNYDFTAAGTTTLVGGQSYWIVAYGLAGDPVYNWKASSPAVPPTGLATHLGSLFDTDGPPPTINSTILCSYSVTAQQVPVELTGFTIE